MRRRRFPLLAAATVGLLALALGPPAAGGTGRSISTDRRWDVLRPPTREGGRRAVLLRAGIELGQWQIDLAGVAIDGVRLKTLARHAPSEPFERVVREGLRRPIDLDDFLLFLDDVLREGRRGRRGELVWLTPGRARKAGILVHPDDVFEPARPRLYGTRRTLSIDRPRPQLDLPPAKDGEPLGPRWTTRYPNPESEREMLTALTKRTGSKSFAERIQLLMSQLREQGAEVYLNSTVRSRHRGYLMWGAFLLSRTQDEEQLRGAVEKLRRANRSWRLFVPIEWMHPAGWRPTREAARAMAETYEVVYATEQGARASSHYTGGAVDLVALALPRRLLLRGADGVRQSFDLSAAEQTRDLSLSPQLIDWVELHFALEKLESDYPHWNDARARAGEHRVGQGSD